MSLALFEVRAQTFVEKKTHFTPFIIQLCLVFPLAIETKIYVVKIKLHTCIYHRDYMCFV